MGDYPVYKQLNISTFINGGLPSLQTVKDINMH